MSLTFATNLTKMIDAGLGGELVAPDTSVAVGYRMQYNLVSGPVASWNDPVGGLPINLVTEFGPIQAGTGDPSPENVRPISGRQIVTVTRSGVNVWDEEWELGYISSSTGEKMEATNRICSKNYISVVGGQSYFIKTYGAAACYDRNKSYISSVPYRTIPGSGYELNIPENARYILFSMPIGYGTTYNHDISINYPATDTAYHPGTVQSVTVQLGDTVYGGRLDVTNGVLTVDSTFITIDGTANWIEYATGKFYVGNVTTGAAKSTTRYISNQYLFSGDGTTSSNQVTKDKRFYGQNSFGRIWLYNSQYTTLEDFKAALSTTPLQIVYPIAQPVTVQLSPQTITSLLGQNNVWSDAGDVSVTWKEKLYTEGY